MMAGGREVNQIGMEGRRRGSKISALAFGEANCWHPGWRGGGWKEWGEEEGITETDRTEGGEWYFFSAPWAGKDQRARLHVQLHVSSALSSSSMSSKGIYSSR